MGKGGIAFWMLAALPIALGVVLLKSIAELDPTSAQAYATIILAYFNYFFILILSWDRLTDKPDLEIKIEGKTRISDNRYAFGVSVLNKGRKDAHNCLVSVQVFYKKSGKKIDERSTSKDDLKSGETKPFSLNGMLAFKNGDFVARISAETHKSKASKIVEYNIRNNDPIIFKGGFKRFLKRLFKKYKNEWDTEFLADGLKVFSDSKIRKQLMERLGEIGDDKAIEPIIDQIIDRLENDPSDRVREGAAAVLGNIGDKRAVDPLLKALREDKVDPKCTSAIVKICDEKCVKELIGILHDSSIPLQIRRQVAKSLGKIGEKNRDANIEKALIEALKDFHEDRGALCDVVEALGKVGGKKAIQHLRQLENIKSDCNDKFKNAIEQIQFRISVSGDNIEEK